MRAKQDGRVGCAFATAFSWPPRRPRSPSSPPRQSPLVLSRRPLASPRTTCHLLPILSPPIERRLTESLAAIRAARVVLCVRMSDPDVALQAATAAVRGGIRCVEITMTTPDAPSLISALTALHPNTHIGAGTVLTLAQADAAAAAGARFALSPAVDADVISRLHMAGVLAVPGAATPTEVVYASFRCGARLVKLFPAALVGGVGLVRALGGPLGHVPLLPTSGIPLGDAAEYLAERNVWAVGASRQVLDPGAVARRDWDEVSERARAWMAATAVVDAEDGGGCAGVCSGAEADSVVGSGSLL